MVVCGHAVLEAENEPRILLSVRRSGILELVHTPASRSPATTSARDQELEGVGAPIHSEGEGATWARIGESSRGLPAC